VECLNNALLKKSFCFLSIITPFIPAKLNRQMLKFGDTKKRNSLILAFITDMIINHYDFLPLFLENRFGSYECNHWPL